MNETKIDNEFVSLESIEETKSSLESKLPVSYTLKLGELNFG